MGDKTSTTRREFAFRVTRLQFQFLCISLTLFHSGVMESTTSQNDDVQLNAPCPIVAQKEPKDKASRIWSSGSEGSSTVFGTVVVHSPTHSASASQLPDLSEIQLVEIQQGVQEYVSTALETLERRLEIALDSISDELTSEVSRERQHLLLMQEKVDMQGQTLQREFSELNKKMHQESTLRTMVSQKYREQNDALGSNLQAISKEIAELKAVINNMETPWLYRAINNLLSVFHQCAAGTCHYERLNQGDQK